MDGILLLATVALATLLAALKGIGKPHMHTNYNDTVRTDSVFYDLEFYANARVYIVRCAL